MALGITIRRKAAQQLRNRLMDYRDLNGPSLDGEYGDKAMAQILMNASLLARAQGLSKDRIRELVESTLGSSYSISA